jgi:hypothetical protein
MARISAKDTGANRKQSNLIGERHTSTQRVACLPSGLYKLTLLKSILAVDSKLAGTLRRGRDEIDQLLHALPFIRRVEMERYSHAVAGMRRLYLARQL